MTSFLRKSHSFITGGNKKRAAADQDENERTVSRKTVTLPSRGKTMSATDVLGKRKRGFGVDQTNAKKASSLRDSKRSRPNTDMIAPFTEVTNTKKNKPTAAVAPTVIKSKSATPKKPAKSRSKLPVPVLSKSKAQERRESRFHMKDVTAAIDSIIGSLLPPGVADIDKDDNDVFNCKDFANDIINYCRNLETMWKLPQAYLEKCPLKNSTRGILIDWIIQVQNHLKLEQQTLHMAIAMIDQYLSRCSVSLGKVQLLGITCLFVASKFVERFAPTVENLIHLTDNSYEYAEVIRMELMVLKVLKFNLSVPTSMVFLDRGLKVVDSRKDKIEYMSRYFLDLTLPHFRMLQFSPSLKAASAVYLANLVIRGDDAVVGDGKADLLLKKSLAFYLGQNTEAIDEAAAAMAKHLVKAESEKLQGAREKYSHRHFLSVSKMSCLQSPILKEIAGTY